MSRERSLLLRSATRSDTLCDAGLVDHCTCAGLGSRLPMLGVPNPGSVTAQALLQPTTEQQLLAAQALNQQLQSELDTLRQAQQQQHAAGHGSAEPQPPAARASPLELSFGGAAVEAAETERERARQLEASIAAEFELSRLRELLAARDRDVVRLRSELALLEASSTSRRRRPKFASGAAADAIGGEEEEEEEQEDEEAYDDALREMAVKLAEAELALQLSNERVVALEARAVVAEQSSSAGAHRAWLAASLALAHKVVQASVL